MFSTKNIVRVALVAVAIAGVCSPAMADTFDGTVDNNWFNAANWSGGVVPNPSIFQTQINGGHAVTATLADAAGGSVLADWLYIGGDGGDGLVNSLTARSMSGRSAATSSWATAALSPAASPAV